MVLVLAAALGGLGVAAGPAFATAPRPPTVEAWLYPASTGQAACRAASELSALAADPVDVLKPEYLVASRGTVQVEDAQSLPCNGFERGEPGARAGAPRTACT